MSTKSLVFRRKELFEAAQDEWNQVQTVEITPSERKGWDSNSECKPGGGDVPIIGVHDQKSPAGNNSPILTFDELWKYVLGTGVHGVPVRTSAAVYLFFLFKEKKKTKNSCLCSQCYRSG